MALQKWYETWYDFGGVPVLLRRGRKYYARVYVPKDMIDLMGRSELKKSLRTTDRKEAKAAATSLVHKAEVAFLRIRTGMLSDREREQVSAGLIAEFTGMMESHKKGRKDALDWLLADTGCFPTVDTDIIELSLKTPKTPADAVELSKWFSARIEHLEGELATEFYSRETRLAAKRIVQGRGLVIPIPPAGWFSEPGRVVPPLSDKTEQAEQELPTLEEIAVWELPAPPEFNELCRDVVQAQIDAFNHELERARGKQNTPLQQQVVARIEKAKPRPRLTDLWDSYRATKITRGKWNEGTAERQDGLFKQILDILGNCELTDLEDEGKAVYLAEMLQKYPNSKEKSAAFTGKPFSPEMAKHPAFKPLSVTSINKCIELASSVLKYARDNPKKWGVDFNAFARSQLADNRAPSEQRDIYELKDLRALLEALKQEMPKWEPENFWIPLLALFTGARQNELCQLRTEDIQELEGMPYIEIRHRPELNQSTKNRRDRTIPIHSVLIELGFMAYCRNQKHERLWPNLVLRKGKWQHEFSKRYNRTTRGRIVAAGGTAGRDFHGLRHTFLNHFKQNLPLSFDNAKVLKSIVGHLDKFDVSIIGTIAEDVTFDRYGKAYAVKKQLELIELLQYDIEVMSLKKTLSRGLK